MTAKEANNRSVFICDIHVFVFPPCPLIYHLPDLQSSEAEWHQLTGCFIGDSLSVRTAKVFLPFLLCKGNSKFQMKEELMLTRRECCTSSSTKRLRHATHVCYSRRECCTSSCTQRLRHATHVGYSRTRGRKIITIDNQLTFQQCTIASWYIRKLLQ